MIDARTRPEAPVALVTGASGTLGAAVATAFAARGARVLAAGNRRKPDFEPSIQLDLTRAEEAARLPKWIGENGGSVDAVVHCVGAARDEILPKMTNEAWSEVLDVNLRSAFLLLRALLPVLIRQRRGHVLLVSSWAGRTGRAGQANYAAAKAGLFGLTMAAAREVASRGVRVNCVVPGVFPSAMTGTLDAAARAHLWDGAAFSGDADPIEMAGFIVDLAETRGITGQVFQLDGRIPPSS
jgi:3-oxoacyl-[acyl-carrier protein] reductase